MRSLLALGLLLALTSPVAADPPDRYGRGGVDRATHRFHDGHRRAGSRAHGDPSFRHRSSLGHRSFGHRSFGHRSFGHRSFWDRSYWGPVWPGGTGLGFGRTVEIVGHVHGSRGIRFASDRLRFFYPNGFTPRSAHGLWKYNRQTRFIIVPRDHDEIRDPEWDRSLETATNLTAVGGEELRSGRPRRAALAFARRVDREPGDAMAWLGFSDALLSLRNWTYAGEAACEGIRARPSWLRTKIDKRGFLGDPASLEPMLDELREHVESRPSNADTRFLLGYNLLMTGRAEAALPHLARAAEIVPWEPVYEHALAVAKERADDE